MLHKVTYFDYNLIISMVYAEPTSELKIQVIKTQSFCTTTGIENQIICRYAY
jgi:hypothetical protein